MTTLDELLKLEAIAPSDWDALLIGDGSGMEWGQPCGWCSVLIERRTYRRTPFHGAWSHGTNNTAEMWAYLHPCLWLVSQRRKELTKHGGYKLHVFTDSSYVAGGINLQASGRENRPLWDLFRSFRRHGLLLTGHWRRRDTLDLNVFSHHVANAARRSQMKLVEEQLKKDKQQRDLSDVTPWDTSDVDP